MIAKDQIKLLSNKAKLKVLNDSDIKHCLKEVEQLKSNFDRITILRFCLKISVRSGLPVDSIKRKLSECYIKESRNVNSEGLKSRYCTWALHYDNINNESDCFANMVSSIKNSVVQSQNIEMLTFLDGAYLIDYDKNRVSLIKNTKVIKSIDFISKISRNELIQSPINSSNYTIKHTNRLFQIEAITDSGTKKQNDDNFLISTYSNHTMIVAICDGCGGASGSNIASDVGLKSFSFAYENTLDIKLSLNFASAAIRNYSILNNVNAETTIVILHISKNHEFTYSSLGDSFIIAKDTLGKVYNSDYYVPSIDRIVLGGEPLGNSITSSGNFNINLTNANQIQLSKIKDGTGFLLGSDGLLTNDDTDFSYFMGIIDSCNHNSISNHVYDRALNSFKKGTKPDNISAIFGDQLQI